MRKFIINSIVVLLVVSMCSVVTAGSQQKDSRQTNKKNSGMGGGQKTGKNKTVAAEPFDKESFYKGYDYFTKNNFKKASPLLFNYIRKNTRDADDYEWAEFFLGISLKNLGFSHAAVESLSYLVTRKPNTKIVTYVLELFEEITRTIPYDYDLLINNAVVDQDYGFVDSDITNFISYHQGVFDWRSGLTEWGNNHFGKIKKESYYHYRYQYQRSLYMILNNELDQAIKLQTRIIESDFQGEDLKNEVRKTLARLLYEKKEYTGSDAAYEEISENILLQAQNLLERSWAFYRLGKYEKSMGLLYALKAPVYQNYITPEYFLLKSLIYKDLCQYRNANSVIEEFREHYRNGLKNVYNRDSIADSQSLLPGILQNRKINSIWLFLMQLEEEKRQIKDLKDTQLKAYLDKVYTLKIEEVTKDLNRLVKDKFEIIANDLLEYEEKADLMSYEIGLDMYQRVYERHYINDGSDKGRSDSSAEHSYALYPFQGEYWVDEFTGYEVTLEDKCDSMDEWDIFFK